MSKRIASVLLLVGLLVLAFPSIAGAADEDLTQALCEDGTASGNGSTIVGGVWSGGNTCSAFSVTINSGDTLTIPFGILLSTSGRVVADGGSIVNAGTIESDDYVESLAGGSINNTGTINAPLSAGSTITNSGTVSGTVVEVHGTLTNSGSVTATDVRVWGTFNNQGAGSVDTVASSIWGTFNNYGTYNITSEISVYGDVYNFCGSTFSAGSITIGESNIENEEDCSQDTSTTSSVPDDTSTTSTIPEVETDIVETDSTGVALLGLVALGALVLAAVTVRAWRLGR